MIQSTQRRNRRAGRHNRRHSAFTLIEVLTTIVIVGVLAGLAQQNFSMYKARARRPEATMFFSAFAKAQRGHKLLYGAYATTFRELDFNLEGGRRVSPTEIQGRIYNYTLSQPVAGGWYVVASGNIDGDIFPDILSAQSID